MFSEEEMEAAYKDGKDQGLTLGIGISALVCLAVTGITLWCVL